MKKIKLTQGKYALVDNEDFKYLNQWKWHAHVNDGYWYAHRNQWDSKNKIQKTIRMHREIMNVKDKEDIDHINHNGLDNQKVNLRSCTHAENCQNQKSARNSSSKYKGVCWHKRDLKWYSRIWVKNKSISLGYFNDEIEAARAYNKAAIKYFGEFAKLNLKEKK